MTNPPITLDRRPGVRRRRLVRLGVSIGVATTLGLIAAAPTDAAGRRMPGDGPTTATVAASRVEVDRPDDRIELLALTCRAVGGQDDAIGCSWRMPQHPDAAAVRLIRTSASADTRTVVHRSGDLSITSVIDAPVRTGVRYVYRLQAVSSTGRIVGVSRPETAGIPADDPQTPAVEVLRLGCEPTSPARVACEWSLPSSDGARSLALWRSVDGGARELVASFPAPFPNSYVDGVPLDASRVVYAVIGENGDGRIVARSRAEALAMPSPPTTTVAPTRPTDPAPTTTAPADTRPVDTRPVDTRPVDTRPVDTRPVDTRPVDTRPSTTTTTQVERDPSTVETGPDDDANSRTDRVRPER